MEKDYCTRMRDSDNCNTCPLHSNSQDCCNVPFSVTPQSPFDARIDANEDYGYLDELADMEAGEHRYCSGCKFSRECKKQKTPALT